MRKLIIDNKTDLPMKDVLVYVFSLLKTGKEEHTFEDGITISYVENKKSDKLIIEKE